MNNEIKNAIAADDVIESTFEQWGDPFDGWSGGFAQWAWDMRRETRTALADGDVADIARDVVYTVAQHVSNETAARRVTDEEVAAWLLDRRPELIAALDESLADD